MLEENRDLLSDITHRECSKEGAAQLPKLLFDIVSHADAYNPLMDSTREPSVECEEAVEVVEVTSQEDGAIGGQCANGQFTKLTSTQEIIRNLPKVWMVLTELLNHQQEKQVDLHVSASSRQS